MKLGKKLQFLLFLVVFCAKLEEKKMKISKKNFKSQNPYYRMM